MPPRIEIFENVADPYMEVRKLIETDDFCFDSTLVLEKLRYCPYCGQELKVKKYE
jgi:hypothetical protein